MGTLLSILGGVAGLGSLVCFIMVVIAMFKHGDTTMGIVTIVTIFCGIGGIVALIYGWMKADAWGIKNLMIAYTVCFLVAILCNAGRFAMT